MLLSRRSIAAAALLLFAGTLSASAETLPEKIRFGAFGSGFGQPYGVAILAIAQGKDFIADQLAALAAGSVDASIGSSSILALRDKGLVNIFYTSKEAGPKAAGFGGILATEAFETKYPEATQRVLRGLLRAAQWIGKDEN